MGMPGQRSEAELSNLVVRRELPAARVTLNRPDKRNALSSS